MRRSRAIALAAVAALLAAAWTTHARFARDLAHARAHAAQGSRVIDTRCGPIEVQEAGICGSGTTTRCAPRSSSC